jgi:hypothetical protein
VAREGAEFLSSRLTQESWSSAVIEYVILGTSHEIQDTPSIKGPVGGAVAKHAVALIAEEYPFRCRSTVGALAEDLRIPYLQIDPFQEDWPTLGIDRELRIRDQYLRRQDIRLSHADSARENYWLKKVENSLDGGRVLVICGYLHVNFLAEEIVKRGGTEIEKSTFPAELLHRKPSMVLDPGGLEAYLKKLRANSVYSMKGKPLEHSGGTERQ